MNKTRLTVYKSNDSFIEIQTIDEGVAREIYDYFSFKMPNAQFHPLVRKRRWDGFIHLFQKKTGLLPLGLYWRLQKFCKDFGYEIDGWQPETTPDFDRDIAEQFAKDIKPRAGGKPITAHAHQIKAFYKATKYRRILLESSTSSGKSLIAYLLYQYLCAKGMKGLYLVPTVGLVNQLYADFEDYSGQTMDRNIHKIYAGQDKSSHKGLIVSTWQSVNKQHDVWYEQFDYVICDEVHTAAAKELSNIMERCNRAYYKIGMTGSLQDAKAHRMALEGMFGPVEKIMTNAEAIEKKIAADLTIKAVLLKYSDEEQKKFNAAIAVRKHIMMDAKIEQYQNEIKFIIESEVRNEFIVNLVKSLKQTTLVLTQSIEHAKLLHTLLEEECISRNVYLIYGDTAASEREDIRHELNDDPTAIGIATYGTFQTGISVRNLHNVVFASFSKSKIRLLQSIGRALRMSETKDKATVWDISDDFGEECFSMKHREVRLSLYAREKFRINEIEVNDDK